MTTSTDEATAGQQAQASNEQTEAVSTSADIAAPQSRRAKSRELVKASQEAPGKVKNFFREIYYERQPAPAEVRAYSETGDHTVELDGTRRDLHVVYTRWVAVPLHVCFDVGKYVVDKPSRLGYTMLTIACFAIGGFLLWCGF